MSIFTGCGTAIVTPFLNGEVDFTALTRLVELQIVNGIDAIVVCGTTGESPTLSHDEWTAVIQHVVERVNGRIPVIAGSGGNNTADVIENCKTAQAIGADGLLVVAPFYNKTSQKGLIAHYTAVADAVETPIIVYNIPGRTGLNVLPQTMAELVRHENIVGIKEASGNIEQIVTLAATCPECDIYSGNDDHVLPILSIGGKGVISTISNIVPQEMHQLCASFFQGDLQAAREMQMQMIPLCKAAFCDVNPIPIKTMMGMLKLCSPELRLPLIPPDAANTQLIRNTLTAYGMI